MKMSWFPYRQYMQCKMFISVLSLISLVGLLHAFGKPLAERDKKRVLKMVDDIANSNKEPRLVNHPKGSLRLVPVFPKNYRWDEQQRVDDALIKLVKDTTVELWEELVKKSNDPRYCLTVMDKGEDAHNLTVGYFCNKVAYHRLFDVFQQHLPEGKNRPEFKKKIELDIVLTPNLAGWRKKRKNKALWQLQIEICEKAISELAKVKDVSDDQKDLAKRRIEGEIIKLRKTKRAVFVKYNSIILDAAWFELYTPKLAKRIAEDLSKKR